MTQTLSSPNRLVWVFADSARALAVEAASSDALNVARQKAAAATVMAVACVEAYLNIRARLLVSQDANATVRAQLERDLKAKKSLGRKLEEWPLLMFGQSADFGSGPAQRFKVVLDRRNTLMHFISDTQSLGIDTFVVNGLIDTTAYDSLVGGDGWVAVQCAEDFIEYLLRIEGASVDSTPHLLHQWIGKVPPAPHNNRMQRAGSP